MSGRIKDKNLERVNVIKQKTAVVSAGMIFGISIVFWKKITKKIFRSDYKI